MSNRKWIGMGYYSRDEAKEIASWHREHGHKVVIRKEYGSYHLLIKRED